MSPTVPPISVMTTSTSSVASLLDRGLDLVGDVRDDLDGLAEVFALAFLLDDGQINLAGGVVAIAGQGGVGEAFVMAQVEVGFGAVVEHVDFAVLIGAHGAGIDVDVGVEFLQADAQAAVFEEHADRGAGEPLAEGADDAAGDEDVLGQAWGPLDATVRARRLPGIA